MLQDRGDDLIVSDVERDLSFGEGILRKLVETMQT